MPATAERVAVRKRIIEYYETTGNRCKASTYWHFVKEIPKGSIYRIIRTYETRKAEGWKLPKRGRTVTLATPENLKKYEELLKVDPNMSYAEGGEILNMSQDQVKKLRKAYLERLNPQRPSQRSEKDKEYLDGWCMGNFPAVAGDPDEGHCHDDESQVKKKQRRRRCHCLACFEQFEEEPEEIKNQNKLRKNLNMVFVFNVILDMSSEEMLELMKLSKGRDPHEWVDFCGNCKSTLEEAMEIQRNIRRLEERLKECKGKIVENVWKTSGLKINPYKKGASNFKPFAVTNRVRDMIWSRGEIEIIPSSNPFDEGDREARSLMPELDYQPKIVVKQEVDNVDAPASVEFSVDVAKVEPGSPNNHSEQFTKDTEPGQYVTEPVGSTEVEATGPSNSECLPNEGGNRMESTLGSTLPPISTQGICDVCGVEMRPLAIPTHMFMVHDIIMAGYSVKYCRKDGCKYKSLYNRHLQLHMKNQHSNLSVPCTFCGKTFANRKKLNFHMEIHRNAQTRPYVCELCGSSFAVKNYLCHHMRISHQKRYYPSTKRKRSRQLSGIND